MYFHGSSIERLDKAYQMVGSNDTTPIMWYDEDDNGLYVWTGDGWALNKEVWTEGDLEDRCSLPQNVATQFEHTDGDKYSYRVIAGKRIKVNASGAIPNGLEVNSSYYAIQIKVEGFSDIMFRGRKQSSPDTFGYFWTKEPLPQTIPNAFDMSDYIISGGGHRFDTGSGVYQIQTEIPEGAKYLVTEYYISNNSTSTIDTFFCYLDGKVFNNEYTKVVRDELYWKLWSDRNSKVIDRGGNYNYLCTQYITENNTYNGIQVINQINNDKQYLKLGEDKIWVNMDTDEKLKVATPVITPDANKVTIACETTDSEIHYTLDGSDPTDESTLYSGEVTLESGQIIKAVGILVGMENSNISEYTYQ